MDPVRKIIRTRSGCATCKSRRVKCDEATPACSQCRKRGLRCPGYGKTFKWLTAREKPKDFRLTSDSVLSVPLGTSAETSSCSSNRFEESLEQLVLQPTLETAPDALMRHYFSTTCVMLSGYDSFKNPFRTQVAELLHNEDLIQDCILSMSAAQLKRQSQPLDNTALQHQTKAISSLAFALSFPTECNGPKHYAQCVIILFGSLLLGMTSTWHEPSTFGLPFLHGARALVKSIALIPVQSSIRQLFDFLVGAVAFWEALVSFHVDQGFEEIDYLSPWCEQIDLHKPLLNPWTGATASLFVIVARVGSLTYKRRVQETSPASSEDKADVVAALLIHAKCVRTQLQSYIVPDSWLLSSTDDENTPSAHLNSMSQAWKLAGELELCKTFPELASQSQNESALATRLPVTTYYPNFLLDLAIDILSIISDIPPSSGTKAVQLFPLVVAGSVLQYHAFNEIRHHHSCTRKSTRPGTSLTNTERRIAQWRDVVRERLNVISSHVGLESAHRGSKIIERVWTEADKQRETGEASDLNTVQLIDWFKIMREHNLMTLFG